MRGYITAMNNSLQIDYTEATFYSHLQSLFTREFTNNHGVQLGLNEYTIEAQPSQTGCFPDFAIWDDGGELVSRIEAKRPEISLEVCLEENQTQLANYLNPAVGHPNLILTNFRSFAFVTLNEAGNVVFDGDVFSLVLSCDDFSGNPPEQLLTSATLRFRELTTLISGLCPAPVNSQATTMNYMALLSHSLEDFFNQETVQLPGNSDEENDVLNLNLEHLRTLTRPFIQDDGRRFGTLAVMGLCMNEFLRRRRGNPFDFQMEEGILPQTSLQAAITSIFAWRRMFGLDNMFSCVMYGLSLHFPAISTENTIDSLEENRTRFEEFIFSYLSFEDEDWVNDFGTVPTPTPIIRYMVRKAEQEWVYQNSNTEGLLSPECLVLDPCAGSGHYYITILEQIYRRAMSADFGVDYARDQVRRAIGYDMLITGRIVALDIQPACILMTMMNLRLFCEQYQINTDGLTPRIYLSDSLNLGELADSPEYIFELVQQGFGITIGNPPWSGHRSFQMGNLAERLRPWTNDYGDWYEENINSAKKIPNPNLAFAFLHRFVSTHNSDIVSFVIPSTICYSAQWMGARTFFRENGFRVRVDHLGGEVGSISRDDGESVFVNNGVVLATTACSVVTVSRPSEINADADIRARICWNNPDRWETNDKWEALNSESPLVIMSDPQEFLPAESCYPHDYSSPAPPHHFWAPSADGFDGACLGLLARYDMNYNGMEPSSGNGYRLVDTNQEELYQRMLNFFSHQNLQQAIDGDGGTWISDNFNETEHQLAETKFTLVSNGIEQNPSWIRSVSMGCMVETYAFTPSVLADNGDDRVQLWHRMKVHQYTLPDDEEDDIARGYFLIPQTTSSIDGQIILGGHIPFYPGHKDTAKRNGRAFPRMVHDGENWVANLRVEFRGFITASCGNWERYESWMNNEITLAVEIWDYILAVYSSTQMVNSMEHPNTCYLTNLPFPRSEEVFENMRSLGEFIRVLQSFEALTNTSIYSQFYSSVSNFVGQNIALRSSPDESEGEVVELNQFEIFGQKTDATYSPRTRFQDAGEVDGNSIEDLELEFQNLSDILGLEQLEIHEDMTQISAIRLNSGDENTPQQWLHGVPRIATNLVIGGHHILRRWLTWNSNSGGRLHPTWNDEHRQNKYTELIVLIRNLTSLGLIQPMADSLFDDVIADLSSWHQFQNPN